MTITDLALNVDNYRYVSIRGLSALVKTETRAIYGIFERVRGGVVYSAPDVDFDDSLTDDLIWLKSTLAKGATV